MFRRARPIQISQISRITAHNLTKTSSVLLFHPYTRSFSSSSSLSTNPVVEGVTVDQTKKGNHPEGDKKGEHEHLTSSARTEVGRNSPGGHRNRVDNAGKESAKDDPMEQPDPQKSPERSTGIETDGPGGSRAGAGEIKGGVHQEKTEKPGPHQKWQGTGSPAT